MENFSRVLKTVDANIDMFSRYSESGWNTQTLEKLKADKEQILQAQRGEIEFDSMTYSAKEWFLDMPAWGTYGT
jgi:hypothetical protein